MRWTRRDFVRASSLGFVGAMLPLPVCGIPIPLSEFRALRRNVGLFVGRGGTIGWLVNRDGIAVVDSQFPDSARSFLNGLEGRNGRPVDLLVNTHHHGDHTAGNPVFRPETHRIVAHARARELHEATGGDDAREGLADEVFETSRSFDVGDERIHLRHYGPAHTGGDCTIHFERADVVHMGDLVFNRAYPFIDRPGGASIRGWIELLEAVEREHGEDAVFVFGHGRPEFGVTGTGADLRVQRDFLSALLEEAGRAVARGRSREELTSTETLPAFPDHRALTPRLDLGAALGVAYDELSGGR